MRFLIEKVLFVFLIGFCIGVFGVQYFKKTELEIKILQHELAAYEAMEKELKSE
jgi:hypothetical protein